MLRPQKLLSYYFSIILHPIPFYFLDPPCSFPIIGMMVSGMADMPMACDYGLWQYGIMAMASWQV